MLHLWLFELESWAAVLESRIDSLITAQDQARARRFSSPSGRRAHRLSRGILRWLLSHYLRCKPRELHFHTGTYGKPHLVGEGLQFNLSHSSGVLAIGVADTELGVDVEAGYSGLKADELATSLLGPEDFHAYNLLDSDARQAYVLRRWTEREAFSKAVGMGLSLDLASCQWRRLDARTLCVSHRESGDSPWYTRYLGRFRDCHLSICSRGCARLQVFASTPQAHIFPKQA